MRELLGRSWRQTGALLGLLLAGLVVGSMLRGAVHPAPTAAPPTSEVFGTDATSPTAPQTAPGGHTGAATSSAPGTTAATSSAPPPTSYAAPSATVRPVTPSGTTDPTAGGAALPRPSLDPGATDDARASAAPTGVDRRSATSGPGDPGHAGPWLGGVDAAWARRLAARTGIPEPALFAYGSATIRASRTWPSCHLGWTTLAGIGANESDHGRAGGSTLTPAGITTKLILGPALDGQNGTAAIRATATGTAMHGDPTWDHAMGPMQFITSSWGIYGADGDGDGVADPHNINDASWAAARHLCGSGQDMATGAGWSAAILGYNRSNTYLINVFDAAQRYANQIG